MTFSLTPKYMMDLLTLNIPMHLFRLVNEALLVISRSRLNKGQQVFAVEQSVLYIKNVF